MLAHKPVGKSGQMRGLLTCVGLRMPSSLCWALILQLPGETGTIQKHGRVEVLLGKV